LVDAFDKNKPPKSVNGELIRHKVPFHLGGMADPFQTDEWTIHNTYKLIELTNKYHYPMMISTKVAHLPEEYWKILNPEIHAFQISLFTANQEVIDKFEGNTPSVEERL
jgi:DNA repair photolyase